MIFHMAIYVKLPADSRFFMFLMAFLFAPSIPGPGMMTPTGFVQFSGKLAAKTGLQRPHRYA